MSRLLATLVVIVVVVGVVLGVAGVLHFQNTNDEATITIDKKDLKDKTENAVKATEQAGGKILDTAGDTMHHAAQGLRNPSHEHRQPAPTSPSPD